MLRFVTGYRPEHSALTGAWLTLAVLLAHLVAMATPLHTPVVHAGQAMEHTPRSLPHHSPGSADSGHLAAAEGTRDCFLLWVVPSQDPPVTSLSLAAPAVSSCLLTGLTDGLPPLPRTLGPPLHGDWQALQQVLRL